MSKLQIQINLLDFSFQRRKFKYIFMINFLDFSCQNCKFKSIYRIFLVKDTNSNIFSWFFMVYYKFGYFLLFLLSKFEFEWMWQIFLVKNTSFLLLTCSFFTTFSIFEFWPATFSRLFLIFTFDNQLFSIFSSLCLLF